MPTYEYICESCSHTLEIFQSISAASLKRCPKCRKHKLKRLIGAGAGIIFKGSGFYETDYKKVKEPQEKTEKASSDSTGKEKTSESKDKESTEKPKDGAKSSETKVST